LCLLRVTTGLSYHQIVASKTIEISGAHNPNMLAIFYVLAFPVGLLSYQLKQWPNLSLQGG